jgi:hypothetical protein
MAGANKRIPGKWEESWSRDWARGTRRLLLETRTEFVMLCGKRAMQLLVLASLTLAGRIGHGQSIADTGGKRAQIDLVTVLQQQIGLDAAAPNERNPKGLRIQFEKLGEVNEGEGHTVRYRLLIPGAPEKQSYVLGVWRIGVAVKSTPQQVYTNAKGLVMWHPPVGDQEKAALLDRDNEIEVDLKAARGEPVRYVLASPDGKYFFPGTVVPYPVGSKDGKCRLEARLGLPEAEGIVVYADGLAPNAVLPLQTDSEGEKHAPMLSADAQGHAAAIVEPEVAGRNAGVVKISLVAPGCSVSVDMPWGAGSYQPL